MLFTLTDIDATKTIQLNSFEEVLKHDVSEYQRASVKWDDITDCCALDIDHAPDHVDLHVLTRLIQPVPKWAWVTRSNRGLRAIYHRDVNYDADEIAAMAIWYLSRKIPELKCEFLHKTFHPMDSSVVANKFQLVEDDFIQKLIGRHGKDQLNEEQINTFLEERGMQIGGRYPHSYCPFDPARHGERNPVHATDSGIYCYLCTGRGGSHAFRSYVGLLGAEGPPSDFRRLVKSRTHWEHAKYILRELTQLSDNVNERLYSSSLAFTHGEGGRDAGIFTEQRNCIRVGDWWATENGEVYNKEIKSLLACLPSVRYTDEKGKTQTDEAGLTKLSQTVNTTELGYPSLDVIRGIRLYGHNLSYSERNYTLVTQIGILRKEENVNFRPQYRASSQSNECEALRNAWGHLERVFPGINRNALYLCLSARGTAEGRIGLPSFIYLSGPSGSGKTSIIKIAAAMLGDFHTEHVWTNSVERVRQGVLHGKQNGMFVSFDEICKNARKAKVDFTVAMDDALNLTPDSTSHQMYIGPVRLGALPAIFWTDTDVPNELRDSVQLGRRIIHCRLSERMDWESSLYESGVDQIERLRIAGLEFAEACDTIISEVIDRFFTVKKDLKTIAKELGYSALIDEVTDETVETLKEFYLAVCQRPMLEGSDAKRWRGEGWKLIELSVPGGIMDLWEALQDSDNPKTSRRCSEANWPVILRVSAPVEFELQSHGSKLAVRFVKRTKEGQWINEKIIV